jgi:UTP--glucose-1-phosphate uridylyltransferase
MKTRKAVIPAAGLGTRFLPATRSVPKVLIPVLGQPAIHYAVEEAARAGIEQVVLVISPGQEAVGSYFGTHLELEAALERNGRADLLERMKAISNLAEVRTVPQEQPLGLGHAVLTARAEVGDEPFAVFLPDDIIWSETPTIGKMMEFYSEYGGSVIAVQEVPDEAVSSLGIIDHKPLDGTLSRVVGMVEKPPLAEAPSNLAIVGRYVLTPQVFDALESIKPGALGEYQLTDAIASLLPAQDIFAYRFPGAHFDVGTPLGLLKASVYAAMQRGDISADLRDWLKSTLG